MSLRAILWVFDNSDATLGARLVLLALAEYAHDDGSKAFPTVATIASKTRLSERSVQLALGKLATLGEIEKTGATKAGVNVYRIVGMGVQNLHRGGAIHDAVGVQNLHPTQEQDPKETTSPPSLVKIDGRNLGFDALAEVCAIDTRNRRRVGEITKALKEIRVYVAESGFTGEEFEREVAAQIRLRAELYRTRMRGLTMTPLALAKWWHDVEKPDPSSRVSRHDFDHIDDIG